MEAVAILPLLVEQQLAKGQEVAYKEVVSTQGVVAENKAQLAEVAFFP